MPDFLVTETPVLTPTCCAFCRTSADPAGFIDGGRDIFSYGQLYICAGCATQAGTRFGMLTDAEATGLEETISRQRAELDQLRAELAEVSDHIIVSKQELRTIVRELVK